MLIEVPSIRLSRFTYIVLLATFICCPPRVGGNDADGQGCSVSNTLNGGLHSGDNRGVVQRTRSTELSLILDLTLWKSRIRTSSNVLQTSVDTMSESGIGRGTLPKRSLLGRDVLTNYSPFISLREAC